MTFQAGEPLPAHLLLLEVQELDDEDEQHITAPA